MNVEIGYLIALGGGIVSFLSPCVLPLVPAYLCFMTGTSLSELTVERSKDSELFHRVLMASLAFVAGFSTVFLVLGASASVIHNIIADYRPLLANASGILIVLFGLHYMGALRSLGLFRFLNRDMHFHGANSPTHWAGAYFIGLAFAFGWSPCIGPVLGTILTLAATKDSLGYGVSLLAVYSIGLGIPFIIAGVALPVFLRFSQGFRKNMGAVQKGVGISLIAVGLAIFFDRFATLGTYLLKLFPVLGGIG